MKATLLLLLLVSVGWTSAYSRASVTVAPNKSQFSEYEKISVSCEQTSSAGWTVWRYTTEDMKLSQCEVGWGERTSSTCVIKITKLSDSGMYWCRSKHGDNSNTVNITVVSQTVESVLMSPVLPITEGHDVTLSCKTKKRSSNPRASFYKDDSFIGTEPEGHMTIRNFSKSHEAAYKCNISGGFSSPSWLLMEDDSDPVRLTTSPDSSQLLEYDTLSLSCGNASVHGWNVIRSTTSEGKISSCVEWGKLTSTGCVVQLTKLPDSATYWCQSPAHQRSNSVQINVYGSDRPVILQSPVLPVMEGHDVTLSCRTKRNSSDPRASFYKGKSFIRTEPEGLMTIQRVSRSDEGLYRCTMSDGESPPSWLFVTDPHGSPPSAEDSTLSWLGVMRHLLVVSPYCAATVLMVSVYQHRPTGRNQPVSMTTSPPSEDDEGLDQPYDDVIADITTEHEF
ncbi:sialoadhesin-like [Cebidichthys violaceus]|uniref:sialoadhesin-like n=1 Tax=Cebidichthys violaceus TaxID=271503 RepID=UPI0035CC3218